MHPLVNIALRAARDAAQTLAHSSDRLDRVEILDDDSDNFLTSMDETSESTLLHHLRKAHPHHTILSRASGLHEGSESDVTWLIDPLAGNRNFAAGYQQFAVSVACVIEGTPTHAVVVNPLLGEEYISSRGDGAQLNSRRIRVGQAGSVSGALIALDIDHLPATLTEFLLRQLMHANAVPRVSGCPVLDLVHTASNRLQAGIAGSTLNPAETAGALILSEAGGLIASETGHPELSKAAQLLYGNPKIFKSLLQVRGGFDN